MQGWDRVIVTISVSAIPTHKKEEEKEKVVENKTRCELHWPI